MDNPFVAARQTRSRGQASVCSIWHRSKQKTCVSRPYSGYVLSSILRCLVHGLMSSDNTSLRDTPQNALLCSPMIATTPKCRYAWHCLSGGQGNAEVRPERRLRAQDRSSDGELRWPSPFSDFGIEPNAINLTPTCRRPSTTQRQLS